jgi:molybdopterin-guanine dinucleotide biosynthesis protein A
MASFSAALLAGGKSTRMGRDKALLPMPGSDLLLWQRQLGVLEELHPDEFFWSGPPRPGLPPHVRVVPDLTENAGPLAGLGACLNLLQSDLLIVLAVDLPRLNADFLREMQKRCSPGCGIVAQKGEYFEPLAAIYPKEIHKLVVEHLQQGRYVMQELVRAALERKCLQSFAVEKENAFLFENWNRPDDKN